MKRRLKSLSLSLVLCFLVQAVNFSLPTLAAGPEDITAAFPNFGDSSLDGMLYLNGLGAAGPQVQNDVLILTPDSTGETGSAFLTNKIALGADRSFSTFFTFKITHSDKNSPPANGFCFVMSANNNTYGHSETMGYDGLQNSIAVEFDVYDNTGGMPTAVEPGDNHLGFDLNGSGNSVQALEFGKSDLNLADGSLKYAWVDFSGASDTLTVTVSGTPSRDAGKTMTVPNADISAGLTSPDVYAGFTASTGSYSAEQEIDSWYFNADYSPIDSGALSTYKTGAADISIASDPSDGIGDGSDITFDVSGADGSALAGMPLTLSTNRGTLSKTAVTTDANGEAAVRFVNLGSAAGVAEIRAVTPDGILAVADLNCLAAFPSQKKAVSLSYPDFGNTANSALSLTGMNAGGSAAIANGILSLTPNGSGHQAGDAFTSGKITLGADRSFSSFFEFRITPGSMSADGFVFVLTNGAASAGGPHNSMGFPTNVHDIGIEFDTYCNGELGDPNGNHIGFDVNGDPISKSVLNLDNTGITISDGQPKYAWVDYDGSSETLTVTVSNSSDRSAGQSMTVHTDLSSVLTDGGVYAGFTAEHYGSGQQHDILSWYFNSSFQPMDPLSCQYVAAPASVALSAFPATRGVCRITSVVRNADGSPAKDTALQLSANSGTLDANTVTTDENGVASVHLTYDAEGSLPIVTAVAEGGATGSAAAVNSGILLKGDQTVYLPAGSSYTDAGASAFDITDGDISGSLSSSGQVNTSKAGHYTVTYTASDSTGDVFQAARDVYVVDNAKPVITLNGNQEITVEGGSAFTDPGATAVDNCDGDLSAQIVTTGKINTRMVGDQTLTYTVTDSSGNAANPVTRVVHVVDTTKPFITLVGDASVKIAKGSAYTDMGAMASDACDDNVTNKIAVSGTVDTSKPGTYTLTYTVTDASGNAADPVTRMVEVTGVGGSGSGGSSTGGNNTSSGSKNGSSTSSDSKNGSGGTSGGTGSGNSRNPYTGDRGGLREIGFVSIACALAAAGLCIRRRRLS